MSIDTSTWHYRVYAWWAWRVSYTGQENLCHYMRVILFWSPATWLTHSIGAGFYWLGARTGAVGVAVGNWRVWLWGGWKYAGYVVVAAWAVMIVAGFATLIALLINAMVLYTEGIFFWTGVVFACVVGGVLAIGAIALAGSMAVEFAEGHRLPRVHLNLPSVRPSVPSIVPLWWTWVMAKKHHICPFITFEEGERA